MRTRNGSNTGAIGWIAPFLLALFVWMGLEVSAQTPAPALDRYRIAERNNPLPTAIAAEESDDGLAPLEAPNPWVLTLQMLAALGFVMGLIFVFALLTKKYLPAARRATAGPDAIVIQSVRSIGPRRSLLVVRVRGRNLLLGSTATAITRLADLDMPPGSEMEPDDGGSFESELAAAVRPER